MWLVRQRVQLVRKPLNQLFDHEEHPVTDHMNAAIEAGNRELAMYMAVPVTQEEYLASKDQMHEGDAAKWIIKAAEPHIRAKVAQEILERLPESGPHINMTQYREGILDGMNRAIRIAKGPQQ